VILKTSLSQLLSRIPGAPSRQWPDGERYATGFEHGTMSLGLYAPVGSDPQQPHKRDEIYIVEGGTGTFVLEDRSVSLAPGDAVFVPAGASHRFEDFSPDFRTWVIFWGPDGGESSGEGA